MLPVRLAQNAKHSKKTEAALPFYKSESNQDTLIMILQFIDMTQ